MGRSPDTTSARNGLGSCEFIEGSNPGSRVVRGVAQCVATARRWEKSENGSVEKLYAKKRPDARSYALAAS